MCVCVCVCVRVHAHEDVCVVTKAQPLTHTLDTLTYNPPTHQPPTNPLTNHSPTHHPATHPPTIQPPTHPPYIARLHSVPPSGAQRQRSTCRRRPRTSPPAQTKPHQPTPSTCSATTPELPSTGGWVATIANVVVFWCFFGF